MFLTASAFSFILLYKIILVNSIIDLKDEVSDTTDDAIKTIAGIKKNRHEKKTFKIYITFIELYRAFFLSNQKPIHDSRE